MKDTSVIPKGDYCYTWIEVPGVNNNFVGKTKVCPYAEVKDINGVHVPWCNYLELGGYPGSGKWAGWEDSDKATEILNKHFGSEQDETNICHCSYYLMDAKSVELMSTKMKIVVDFF